MERNFYNEEFEQFLKQKSDQYKMYPSDRVWANVYSSLHTARRWTGFGIALVLITLSALISREIFLENYTQVALKVNQSLAASTFPGYSTTNTHNQKNEIQAGNLNNKVPSVDAFVNEAITTVKSVQASSGLYGRFATNDDRILSTIPVFPESQALVLFNASVPKIRGSNLPPAAGILNTLSIPPKQKNSANNTKEKEETAPTLSIQNYVGSIGMLKTSKWSLQLYASPIVSYRRLSNFNNRSDKYVPVAINYAGNLDNYVHHKPAIGFEFGTKVNYEISKSLHLYLGAQLNYSRYYIDAFNYHSEKASIALNNAQVADTVSNYTSIRNFDGYSPEQLQNQYLQLSVPVGAELRLLGNKRFQLSIAGAIQPTYLISSNSYLISSDYKNYIQNPDLARRFNVHTNFEAFVSYKMGGLKWQLGPQFRYQLLSSYSDKYPIREYLTEFGIKLGITKTIW